MEEGFSSSSITTNTISCNHWKAEETVAGNAEALEALRKLIIFPIKYSKEAKKIGLKWSRGLLLCGPPGTGKTSMVRGVVREGGAHLTVISAHSVFRGFAGESERILREAFAEASSHASIDRPSVVFIDEIDILCPKRDSRSEQANRLVSQLSVLMDANKSRSTSHSHVVVVACTNRVDAVDPDLRRPGRFDVEVEVTIPNEDERLQILKLYSKKLPLDSNVDLEAIAASCNGYVGADLEALCIEATKSAIRRSSDATKDGVFSSLTVDDWDHARSRLRPSITRGFTVEIPKVSWEDIGGLKELKKKLQQAVEWPIKHSATFSRLGASPPRGILLHGPSGCSKTTLAKAVIHAAQASLFCLSGADVNSKYVGEGEALLRNTFQRARLAAPSIIFFDEFDAIAVKRGDNSSDEGKVGEKITTTLLTEMDGLVEAKGVLVLATTNRLFAVDDALMRPGRFNLVLHVPLPDLEARLDILRVHTRKMALADDVDLERLAEETDHFTGADLEGLCNEAGMVAIREDFSMPAACNRHFQAARQSLKPSLTKETSGLHESLRGSLLTLGTMKVGILCSALSVLAFYLLIY